MAEIEPSLRRMPYDTEHWDEQIYLYREREKREWRAENQKIVDRILNASFSNPALRSPFVHVLDLHADGFIRSHVDADRYCGAVISGVSLLSSCVMRLRQNDRREDLVVDMLLPRRSLYKLTDIGRYEFAHEVLAERFSFFRDEKVSKGRRISVICRELPRPKEQTTGSEELKRTEEKSI